MALSEEHFAKLAERVWKSLGTKNEPPEWPTKTILSAAIKARQIDISAYEEHSARMEALCATFSNITVYDFQVESMVYLQEEGLKHTSNEHLEAVFAALRNFITSEFDNYHDHWMEARRKDSTLRHPLVPFIKGWFERTKQIKSKKTMRTGILPASLRGARALSYGPERNTESLPLGNTKLPLLPSFELPVDTIIPTNVIETYRAAGGKVTVQGHGAPISMRTFFEIFTELTHDERRAMGGKELTWTLRDLRDRIYMRQEGKRQYFTPKRDIGKIIRELEVLDLMRWPVTLPGYEVPTLWRPISVIGMPLPHLDSPIEFYIKLPPGSSNGALIDRYAMRRYGARSAPQYAAALGLAYFWDKYGTHKGKRILASRPRVARNSTGQAISKNGEIILDSKGRPIRGFDDARLVFLNAKGSIVDGETTKMRRSLAARERNPAIERYPVLTPFDQLILCFPTEAKHLRGNSLYDKRRRAREALEGMAEDGYIGLERGIDRLGNPGYRVAPLPWSN